LSSPIAGVAASSRSMANTPVRNTERAAEPLVNGGAAFAREAAGPAGPVPLAAVHRGKDGDLASADAG
jgi:hypothetical protein